MKATLVAEQKLSEEAVYDITKALFDHLDEFGEAHAKGKEVSLEAAVQGVSVPLHPGAAKYFSEKGIK